MLPSAILRLSAGASVLLLVGCVRAGAQTFPNIRVSAPGANQPEEVTIAINPLNPLQLAAGSNLRYTYRSADGGYTWTQGTLPSSTWGDPSVAFDGRGRLFYGHLSRLATGYFIDRLIVHRSTDGGATWLDSVEVGYNPPRRQQDKEWITADLTGSPYANSLYMSWTEFDSYGSTLAEDSTRIMFSRSTDAGTTWSPPVRLSDRGGGCRDDDNTVEGAVPAVGPEGTVYVAWSGPLGIMLDRSSDGGVTWGRDIFVAEQPGGWNFDVPGVYRCNGFPVTACDASPGSFRGRVYVLWGDQRNGPGDSDVLIAHSTDDGSTWSSPRRVNTDASGRHQFFPWMAVDQSTGHVYAVFYDRRETVGNGTDVFLARSVDGGESFQNVRISDSSFDPDQGIFFGDYTNIAAAGGRVHPIWMRMDAQVLSIWTAVVPDSAVTSVREAAGSPLAFELEQNFPNPFNPSTEIRYRIPHAAGTTPGVRLAVFDLLGREIAVLVDAPEEGGTYTVRFDARRDAAEGADLATGVYVYRLTVGERSAARRMMILR